MPHEYLTKRRIEFADTDLAGIVHFARFFVFMETAEHEFLRSIGTSVAAKMDQLQLGWPRLEAHCVYYQPLRFEDVVDIRLSVEKKGRKSLTYLFEFIKEEVLVARGRMSSVCCVCKPDGKLESIPIPDFISQRIQESPNDKEQNKERA